MGLICIRTIDTKIELDIDSPLTVIGGDSGSGKTFLMKFLSGLQANPDMIVESSYPIEKMRFIMNEKEIADLEAYNGNLVFIDRFDIYSDTVKKKIYKKMKEQTCTWVVAARQLKGMPNLPGSGANSLKALNTEFEQNKKYIYFVNEM